MSDVKFNFTILNLTGELSQELRDYFALRQAQIVDPLHEDPSKFKWTHILTKDLHDFTLIQTTYQVVENDIKVLSLSKVNDLQNFILNNGKMVFDEKWLKGSLGHFILDKFFQGYAGMSLEENYPKFEEKGSFNVVNPFNTSEYLDRLVYKAHEEGASALSVKTYFDHVIMYLTSLKNANKVGFPIEVTYGKYEEIFGVQLHFFTQNLEVRDISSSLSSSISKNSEEHLLNISVQSTDFFDFTFINKVNKVVLTALWSQGQQIKNDQRGFMFSQINPSESISLYPTDSVTPSLIEEPEIKDISDMVKIAGHDEEEDQYSKVVSGSEASVDASRSIFSADVDLESPTLVAGKKDAPDVVTQVKGKFEKENSITKVSGSKTEEDKSSSKISGQKDEKESLTKVSGGKTQEDKSVFKVGGGGSDNGSDNINVRSLPGQPGTETKTGEFNFTNLGGPKEPNGTIPLFKTEPSNREKDLEAQLKLSQNENDKLRNRVVLMASELKSAKDREAKLSHIQDLAARLGESVLPREDKDFETRNQFQHKFADAKSISDSDLEKLKALMERESKLIEDLKNEEVKNKRLIIESVQKETLFGQELEKAKRASVSKDMMIVKTKETLTKVIEKKDQELNSLKLRFDQLNRALAANLSQIQASTIKDLEKQNQNLAKMNDIYKEKLTSIATSIEASKSDDTTKEESRRMFLLNSQLKNQVDFTKRELSKYQDRVSNDSTLILNLKQEKSKLEDQLKKVGQEASRTPTVVTSQSDDQVKRLQVQNQSLESNLKESLVKIRDLEKKLIDNSKLMKNSGSNGDDSAKVKVNHLEGSLKKITQDLVASQTAVAEGKKEINKLRQEKVSLQNQMDRIKKDMEKLKPKAA